MVVDVVAVVVDVVVVVVVVRRFLNELAKVDRWKKKRVSMFIGLDI